MKLGKQLIELRKAKKITQKELGMELGLSASAISNYERDRHEPDYDVMIQFAEYYDVSLDYLFGRTQFQFPLEELNCELSNHFTVADLANTVLDFDKRKKDQLVNFTYFLSSDSSNKKDK